MSDSRFHLYVEFEIYGQKFKWNPSLNYFDNGDGVDERIVDWFRACYAKAHENWCSAQISEIECDRKKREEAERAELRRLLSMYPDEAKRNGVAP